MSSYIHFFVKSPQGQFLPIGTYSRNSAIYRKFDHCAPYEKVATLTPIALHDVIDSIDADIAVYNDQLAQCDKALEFAKTCSDSFNDKLELFYNTEDNKAEIKDEIESLMYARNFAAVLDNILDDIKYMGWEEDGKIVDELHYIYVGIECGYQPEIAK